MGIIPINEPLGVVPDSFLEKFERFACGDVVLVISDLVVHGEEFPKDPISVPYKLKSYAEKQRWIIEKIIQDNVLDACDSIIVIPKSIWVHYTKYPAYVALWIGHELGHSKIAFESLELSILGSLVYNYIKTASSNIITQPHLVPHEKICDKYGLYIAECLYSRDILNIEIEEVIQHSNLRSIERLKCILTLKSTVDFSRLREMLIEFSRPYKSELISLWENQKDDPKSLVNYFIENYLYNASLDSLFVL